MLFCRNCGQSKYIDGDTFIQSSITRGSETRYLDPDTERVVDYGDHEYETVDSGDIECPYCNSADVAIESNVSEEECRRIRFEYDTRITAEHAIFMEELEAKKVGKEWDN